MSIEVADGGFGIVISSPSNTVENDTIANFDMYGWGQQAIAVIPAENNQAHAS